MKNIPLYEVREIRNLKEMLNSSAELFADKAAFLSKGRGGDTYSPISYRQFKNDVDAFGTALISLGLKGAKIAIIGENRYEWSISYLAVVNGTGIVVPLDKELPENEIQNLLVRSEADAIIYSGSKKEQIESIAGKIGSVRYFIGMDTEKSERYQLSFSELLEKGHELLKSGDRSFIDAKIDEEAMSILLFTSGTTDTSKAVMLSHKNICSNLMAMCSMTYIDDKDTFLSILPIHHTYECTCGFLAPLYRGATIAYCEGLRHIMKNLAESKATIMLGVPLIFETMYKRIWDQAAKSGMARKLRIALRISSVLMKLGIDMRKKLFSRIHESFGGHVRLFISGAAAIDPAVARGFRNFGINFLQGYGLTECSPIVALNRDVDFKDNAAGIPLHNLSVKIDKPNSEGVGEILVKGPSVMLGYYQDEEATAKAFEDGWFHTGDLGYIDKDNFVIITGRKKNVIVTKNGKNIYPEEIESMLDRSPYIKESLVYGKHGEDDETIVAAIIVPDIEKIEEVLLEKPSEGKIRAIIQEEIKKINKSLVSYKYIRDFRIKFDEFAKTTTKKIKRYMERIDQK